MYFKKEIIISFFIITISASNLYMPMIWLYLFLLDFLIPFLCDPDLQCGEAGVKERRHATWEAGLKERRPATWETGLKERRLPGRLP